MTGFPGRVGRLGSRVTRNDLLRQIGRSVVGPPAIESFEDGDPTDPEWTQSYQTDTNGPSAIYHEDRAAYMMGHSGRKQTASHSTYEWGPGTFKFDFIYPSADIAGSGVTGVDGNDYSNTKQYFGFGVQKIYQAGSDSASVENGYRVLNSPYDGIFQLQKMKGGSNAKNDYFTPNWTHDVHYQIEFSWGDGTVSATLIDVTNDTTKGAASLTDSEYGSGWFHHRQYYAGDTNQTGEVWVDYIRDPTA